MLNKYWIVTHVYNNGDLWHYGPFGSSAEAGEYKDAQMAEARDYWEDGAPFKARVSSLSAPVPINERARP